MIAAVTSGVAPVVVQDPPELKKAAIERPRLNWSEHANRSVRRKYLSPEVLNDVASDPPCFPCGCSGRSLPQEVLGGLCFLASWSVHPASRVARRAARLSPPPTEKNYTELSNLKSAFGLAYVLLALHHGSPPFPIFLEVDSLRHLNRPLRCSIFSTDFSKSIPPKVLHHSFIISHLALGRRLSFLV